MIRISPRSALGLAVVSQGDRRRVLRVACGTHAFHDGLTDTHYALLPLWQAEFGLAYGAVRALRSLYTAARVACKCPRQPLGGGLAIRACS
jgi:MFS transporter, FSR family, fosmidomycin resistance protein